MLVQGILSSKHESHQNDSTLFREGEALYEHIGSSNAASPTMRKGAPTMDFSKYMREAMAVVRTM